MAKRRLEMFSHLPEPVQKMFEMDDDQEIVNFIDHFSEGGPVVLVLKRKKTPEEIKKFKENVYKVCSDIIYEMAEEEARKKGLLGAAPTKT